MRTLTTVLPQSPTRGTGGVSCTSHLNRTHHSTASASKPGAHATRATGRATRRHTHTRRHTDTVAHSEHTTTPARPDSYPARAAAQHAPLRCTTPTLDRLQVTLLHARHPTPELPRAPVERRKLDRATVTHVRRPAARALLTRGDISQVGGRRDPLAPPLATEHYHSHVSARGQLPPGAARVQHAPLRAGPAAAGAAPQGAYFSTRTHSAHSRSRSPHTCRRLMTGFETQVINELAFLKLYRAVSKTPHLNVIPSLGPFASATATRSARTCGQTDTTLEAALEALPRTTRYSGAPGAARGLCGAGSLGDIHTSSLCFQFHMLLCAVWYVQRQRRARVLAMYRWLASHVCELGVDRAVKR